jgi:hypothetical protein
MAEISNTNNAGAENLNNGTKKRSWPVTILGLLLIFQAIGLFGLGALHFSWVDLEGELTPQDFAIDLPVSMRGVAFIALGFLALLAAAGFLRLWTSAWLYAVMVQGLSLGMAIFLYFRERSYYAYPLMLYCIIMVIYLNYSEVLFTFRTERPVKDWGGIDER